MLDFQTEIIGQDVTDNTKKDIAKEIKKIEPKPLIDIHYFSVANMPMGSGLSFCLFCNYPTNPRIMKLEKIPKLLDSVETTGISVIYCLIPVFCSLFIFIQQVFYCNFLY
ncbi:Uncharacterised protein (plasmid) [Legionella adelaidensis]|uniref:Uncharacterized protein n=1 Tax=Legionella adelaidensis TaxID=45056 RepID=A0A0W0R1W5_9GAMM|nr:hypothetical protein [Legionella adelaidensis]KTC65018.1 hypothetical protein Lade_1541 [Legionella adelaidensis]VEH85463.1 Uncharacterised protein [Legionella adelaidensis]